MRKKSHPPEGFRQLFGFATVRQAVQVERVSVIMEAHVGLVHRVKVIVELCHNSFFVQDTLPAGQTPNFGKACQDLEIWKKGLEYVTLMI